MIPTPEQGLYITLSRVCTAVRVHFGVTLSEATQQHLAQLSTLAQTELGLAHVPDTRSAKLACVRANIEKATRADIKFPVSWILLQNDKGLSCLRFSLSCLGFHKEQKCSLCHLPFKGFGHFFSCQQQTVDMR